MLIRLIAILLTLVLAGPAAAQGEAEAFAVDEIDALYEIQLQCGQTRPVLVVEDPDRTAGQIHRIHYGRFAALKNYKRRNPAQTQWELEIEDWG